MRLSLNSTSEYNRSAYKKPLRTNYTNNVSFKGFSATSIMKKISGFLDRSRFLTSYSEKFDVENTLNAIRLRIGSSADVLYNHIKQDEIIRNGLIEKRGELCFRNKKPVRLIIDGIIYPVAKIPFYLFYGLLNKLKRFDSVRNSEWLKAFEKSSFYHASHSYLKKDDKLNALRGLMEIGSQKTGMGAKARAKSFLHNTAKTFDSKYGNYNGVHERALTRIVTGLIPAYFLANDAYNLSILCTNNKKDAQNERSLRFKQEVRRVLSNAYLQLITLGALSKFINKSKTWFVGVTIGTVLFSEIYSRVRTGKKIHFISPEEAKELHEQEKIKSLKEKVGKGLTFVLNESASPIKVSMDAVEKFKESQNKVKFKGGKEKENNSVSNKNQSKENENEKSIVTLNGFLKYVAGVIAAGFAIKHMKKIPVGKHHKVGDFFSYIAKNCGKLYTKITMRPNHIKKAEMQKVINKMKNCGFETLARNYEKVVIDYQKLLTLPRYLGNDVLLTLRKNGNAELANYLEILKSGKNSKKMLENLRQNVIKHNFEVFKQYLKKRKCNALLDKINKVTKENGLNYDKLKKVMNSKENEPFKEIFENVFSVDDNTLKLGLLTQVKRALIKYDASNLWNTAEQKAMSEIKSKDYYDLGMKKVPILKDTIDFCMEPFKFVWGYATLPYKGIKNLAGALKSKPRKPLKDIDAVARAMVSLSKKTDMQDKLFTDMFNEKVVKGFNSMTMSKVVNSELSALAKSASIVTTISFRISDHYNMVMIKSAGNDKDEANQKGKERCVQELSRFFWQQLFIKLFNNTFADVYNASLIGASLVNTADTTIGEICTRKSVSVPILPSTREEIINLEKNNLSGDGIKSKFFRFMSKLTGKKALTERETNKIKNKK